MNKNTFNYNYIDNNCSEMRKQIHNLKGIRNQHSIKYPLYEIFFLIIIDHSII